MPIHNIDFVGTCRYAGNASDIEVPPAASLQCHSRCRLSWVTCLNRKTAWLFYSHRLTLMTERAEIYEDFGTQ